MIVFLRELRTVLMKFNGGGVGRLFTESVIYDYEHFRREGFSLILSHKIANV